MPVTVNQINVEKQAITQRLREWSDGKREALDEIMPLVYEELRRQAHHYLRRERKEHTLQTAALINEAYIKLIDQKNVQWQNRAHFFAIAAQAMRRVLVDYARTKYREKRGGDTVKLSLNEERMPANDEKTVDLIDLDEALTRLGKIDPQQARVVELKFFSGLTLEETAEVLHISRTTVAREWNVAKAWLRRELSR